MNRLIKKQVLSFLIDLKGSNSMGFLNFRRTLELFINKFWKGGESMCYNCGCGLPDDDHGQGHAGVDPEGKAITNKTFQAAAGAFGMDEKSAKKNTHDLLMAKDVKE